jgi:hypothetical protein
MEPEQRAMKYAILIYEPEAVTEAMTKDEGKSRIETHRALQGKLRASGKLGPVARLMPTTAATTLRRSLVIDGPFAETKEQLVGFYVLDCDSLDEAIAAAKMLPDDTGSLEVRPLGWFHRGG